jgi:hypothetical protein
VTGQRGPWPRARRGAGWTAGRIRANPFAALGLDSRAEVSDDEVRAAWRRVAATTHPDLPGGGDPERFAAAAAAYTELRSAFGRGEARATLAESPGPAGTAAHAGAPWLLLTGRSVRLAFRIVIAAGVGAAGWIAAGPGPVGPALAVGAGTWLILTARRDLSRSR